MRTIPNEPASPAVVSFKDGLMQESFQSGNTEGTFMGLTKREYFAAMAMQGFCADHEYKVNDIAYNAVSVADALINELNK